MRAFYRGYSAATGRRATQVRRLHIVREDGTFPGKQGLCGAHGWGVTQSPAVIIDPLPLTPPDGLTWCRSCVGHAADVLGQLDHVARLLVGLDALERQAAEVAPPEDPCARCQQPRPLTAFAYIPDGWAEFVEVRLCARCHSLSALEDDDNQLNPSVFAGEPVSSFAAGGTT